jgi:hypothetical protein
VSERILPVLLAVAAGLIVIGVALVSDVAAFVVGGVLLATWAWLFFGDVPDDDDGDEDAE